MKQIELHGVSSGVMHMGGVDWLKREILLYDKIGLIHLELCKSMLRTDSSVKALRADTYEYLQSVGVVYEPEIPINSKHSDVQACLKHASEARERFEYEHPSDMAKYLERERTGRKPAANSLDHHVDTEAFLSRAVAIEETQSRGVIATPIIDPISLVNEAPFLKRGAVMQAVIHEFPVPSDVVPFDDLLMLRAENEFVLKRNSLRSWIRKLSAEDWNQNEMTEEIRHLLNEYEEYMRIQGIKHCRSSLSAIVIFSAGLLENAAKLNCKELAESICSIFSENINLAEAEFNAPGRELVYISSLNSRLRA
ncbi:MAG: hypothetical protein WC736_12395 [Gallionella sp.]